MAIFHVSAKDLAEHQQECDCGFVIEVKPGYYICTKQLDTIDSDETIDDSTIDTDETIWF